MSTEQLVQLLWQGLLETCMTIPSTLFAYHWYAAGVLLVVTRPNNIMAAPRFNAVLGTIINFLRSIRSSSCWRCCSRSHGPLWAGRLVRSP